MELIKKIKEAETQAQQIIEQAKAEAAKQAEQARQQRKEALEQAQHQRVKAIDEAVKQIEVHADHLYDSYTGLYRQGWTESPKDSFKQDTFWSRGVGWLTTAIVDTYQYLPEDHAGREPLAEMLRDLSETLLDYQDASGFWHNTLDDDESPLETSGTLMFAYSFRRGLDLGILSDERFEASAQRAMDVCDGTVNRDGEVRRVSVVPGGPNSPLGVALHGQGWYLLAASCFAD